ncbi:SusC/RagA family TonB-linked outer membrane protein [Pedobacter gandavensis]|uniref:SusC/RagA family TonB-linked outer membrane protein n=1 Tax=Pedobacter gandavensis TaxID=2679963 RepID=UPI0029302887|nr:SusC/RagA family TonB-linked outer membrane protein [Pedobacter gandavensis]
MNFNAITTAMSKPWLPPKLLLIMKYTTLLLFLAMMQASAKGYSQINLKEKNAPLERILESIKKQTGYVFFYDSNDVRQTRMSIDVKNASLETVLKACSNVLPLTFKVVGNNVLLRRKDLPISMTHDAFKMMVLKGRVLDEIGKPLPGVSLVLTSDDFKQTAQTNGNGEYVFNLSKSGKYQMTASFVGYEKFVSHIEVKKEDVTANITLVPSNQDLAEVMVVAYGTQTKASFTGSAKTLKAAVINGSPNASVQETLQGNVAGVAVSNGSGQPGAVPNVRIRGIGSVSAGSGPLYVVDGIPLESGQISGLNNFDIESVTVLKDAAAASIYGSRAANGVILITTKSGKAGKTIFSASAQVGTNRVTKVKGNELLNTTEMLELLREGWKNKGNDPALFDKEMTANAVDPNVNTDWFDLLTRNGNYSQFDLSASGGSETTKFYVSGSHYVAKAALLGSDFSRSTANLKLSNQATDKLSFNGGLQINYRKNHTQADGGTFGNPVRMYTIYQPWLRAYNDDGTYDFSYYNRYNPVAQVKESYDESNSYGLLGNFLAKYQILPSLSIENQSNINFLYRESVSYNKSGVGTSRSDGGRATSAMGRATNWVNSSIIRYNETFGDFSLKTYAGYEAQQVNEVANSVSKRNFLPDSYTLDNAAIVTDGGSSGTGNALTSVFFNASADYLSKYYLSASVRRDGSSRFGSEKRYGNFWAVGASWNISAENFMKGQNVISDLRFRTSYGVNGNQDIGNFSSRALYGISSYDNAPGLVFSNFGNNSLTWEKNKPFNLALDFGVLNNRLTGTIEYYTRSTSDLLLDKPISATNGLTSYTDNIGAMRNSGMELELNSINFKSDKDGFGWNTSFNISTLKNKITALNSPIVADGYNRFVGGDYYQLYQVGYAGVDPKNGDALWYTDATKSATTNKYGSAARFNQGSMLPTVFGGLTNTFTYKRFSLSFLLYFNLGNQIYDNYGGTSFSDGSGGFAPTTKMTRYAYENRWTHEGQITDQPKMVFTGTQSGSSSQSSTRFLYDGDYVRLRDVTLGYQLPDQWIKKLNISNARIYFRANNLWTYIKDDRISFDPEVGIDGFADKNVPIYKTALIGLDLKF